jgi:hypothetical protein
MMEDRRLLSTFMVTNLNDSGARSLQAGIQSGDNTIQFAGGLHGTITLTSELLINHGVTINGPGDNQLTVSGDTSRVFEISNNATVSIDQLTIANGHTVVGDGQPDSGNGGGILIDASATLNLDHVVVTNNAAYADSLGNYGSGGAIENDGSLTVTQSILKNNLASGGSFTNPITEGSAGGAIDSDGPSLTVSNSAFTSNEAVGPATGTGEGNGGAINNSSTATISNSTFNDNQALGRNTNGGAISTGENETIMTQPPLAINNCTFTANEAVGSNGANNLTEPFGGEALGGAIANAAPLTITNSTFTCNLAQGGDQGDNVGGIDPNTVGEVYGGGVVNFASSLAISNTTFSGNQAIGGNSAAGPGAPAAGGGLAAEIFSLTNLTNVTFIGNQAFGGSGGTGYPGGSGFGGGFYNGVDSAATVSHALFLANQAGGGAGGSGAAGGVGAGGAIANGGGAGAFEVNFLGLGTDTSSLSLDHSTLTLNVAQGGAGGAGGNGGSGLGGGVYVLGTTTAAIDSTAIAFNAALGGSPDTGGSSGQGVGGGLNIDTGAGVVLAQGTTVAGNFASTSNDDIFGVFTTN